jgi:hypothetical protein
VTPTLEALLSDGWAAHASDSAALADALEAADTDDAPPDLLVEFLRVAVHTLGEHLGDWPRASRLGARTLAHRSPDAATAKAWAHLWVAQTLANQSAATELAYLAVAAADVWPPLLEARFLLVVALVGTGRAAEAAAVYVAALALARGLGDAAPHRAIAVASNNLASELVEAETRTPDETALMRQAADAAREFWLTCGTWLHDERSLYLLALVANVCGEPEAALGHANAALAIIDANDAQPIDAAFLQLARAHAFKQQGAVAASAKALARADAAAKTWTDPGLTSWYAGERARAVGR